MTTGCLLISWLRAAEKEEEKEEEKEGRGEGERTRQGTRRPAGLWFGFSPPAVLCAQVRSGVTGRVASNWMAGFHSRFGKAQVRS